MKRWLQGPIVDLPKKVTKTDKNRSSVDAEMEGSSNPPDAAANNGARLREGLRDKTNTASGVWADTTYRSKANEGFMEKQGFVSKVHRKKPHLKPMPLHIQRSNAGKSVIRSRVEYVFADQKSQTGLFIRAVGITRAAVRIGIANIVYNMRCFLFLEQISITA